MDTTANDVDNIIKELFEQLRGDLLDIRIQDIVPGKRVRVDDGFNDLEPFEIYTVQATDGGRLFIAGKKGVPFFFDDYCEETGGMEGNCGFLMCIYDPAVVEEELRTIVPIPRESGNAPTSEESAP